MSAREEMLARIRTALGATGEDALSRDGGGGVAGGAGAAARDGGGGVPARDGGAGPAAPEGEVPRRYRLRADASAGDLLDLLAGRLADYRAVVRRATPDRLAATIAEALVERGARRVVVPPGLDLPALPADVQAVADAAFTARELDGFDGAITAAAVAIAETGTIVLDGSPDQGRRAITLVPDYHLCIVRADQVVALVPEAIARLRPDRPLTWISGPSATSDIELERVEGVHGPRTLDVILVEPPVR
jgi:L-lactate dehydrogenase complex protein LldG